MRMLVLLALFFSMCTHKSGWCVVSFSHFVTSSHVQYVYATCVTFSFNLGSLGKYWEATHIFFFNFTNLKCKIKMS